ncbi:MAG: polymorphic toxin-type HINT domain-containing protein [Agitococcus sp.]
MHADKGFVAGTLVHTDKGLVPIEQLKVGDMVLSKHESGEGEQAYKRVTKTFKSREKLPIVRVCFNRGYPHNKRMNLFCTANHPFWCVVRQQWLPAIKFKGYYHELIDMEGNVIRVTDDVGYVMATGKAKIGLCHLSYALHRRNDNDYGMMVDFAGNKIRYVGGDSPIWNSISHYQWLHPEDDIILLPHYDKKEDFPPYSLSRFYMQAFRERPPIDFIHPDNPNPDLEAVFNDYVYNIEVEDFHTYYVGKSGILVAAQK